MITTPSGLQYDDTVAGTGETACSGQQVSVHYTGWLYNDGAKGAKFDSSKDRNDPFEFGLGGPGEEDGAVCHQHTLILRSGRRLRLEGCSSAL